MYSVLVAYILFFISGFGALGFHRLYLGKIPTWILWMFTGGFFGIGSFYDFFTLSRQVRDANYQKALLEGIRNNTGNPSWRNVNDGQAKVFSERENTEHVILKLAKANKGIITQSELALAAKISVDEARKILDEMVTKGHAELRVRQSGALVYTIPDLMDANEPLVD